MKKACTTANFKTIFTLSAGVALAGGFWVASTPVAKGVQKTPAEIIQAHLPSNTTIGSATDQQLLDAVCQSVKQSPKDAALIVRTAAGARQTIRTNVLCTALKCGRSGSGETCGWAVDVAREWIKQDPNLASQMTESVSACAPDCRDTFQAALVEGRDIPAEGPDSASTGNFGANVPSNINPPPGAAGGGGSTSSNGGADEGKCTVCHNGHEISIPCAKTQRFVQQHSGDTLGPCAATPITNP